MSAPHIPQKFDFIFTGIGCAGLSLLMRMIRSGKFADKKILLLDKAPKNKNDRTWCFWEKEPGFFEDVVAKSWDYLDFVSASGITQLQIQPYQYKMIRGIDFYNYCFNEITKEKNIEVIYGNIRGINSHEGRVIIETETAVFDGSNSIIFNSIYNPAPQSDNTIYLLQHFKGWIIETPSPAFDPRRATLMDFRVHQKQGTTFAYVMPLSETKALVEYTLFTRKLLSEQQYDEELGIYIRDFLKIDEYQIIEREFGIIPMTNEAFDFYNDGVYHIGTAGGQTKASSGYTFQFIQKQSQRIVDYLLNDKSLQKLESSPKRFLFYDTILLRILAGRQVNGADIFAKFFQRNNAAAVFKFLDNETSITEELKLIASLPTLPFLKAALKK